MFVHLCEFVGGLEDGAGICPRMDHDGVENKCFRFGVRGRR